MSSTAGHDPITPKVNTFCATAAEHTSPVVDLAFVPHGRALVLYLLPDGRIDFTR